MEAAARARLIPPAPFHPPTRAVLAFALLWAVQGAVAFAAPLFADEAYYWHWSMSLAGGYPDHPPAVALWIRAFGHPRIAALCTAPIAGWLLADAARRAGARAWAWLPALLLATPLGMSAFVATPDGPLVLAGAAVVHAVVRGRGGWAGVALGLALWSKSSAVVWVPAVAWALGPRVGLRALAVAAVVYAPHVVWSLGHGGWPWTFQSGLRRWGRFGLPEAIGGQLLVLTPWLAWRIVRTWWRPVDAVDRRLARLGAPVLLFWMGLACVVRVEANWAALAWLPGLVSLVRRGPPTLGRLGRWSAGVTVTAALAIGAFARWGPLGLGPPRDGPRLAACLRSAAPHQTWVTGRYQEQALLRWAGVVTAHQRAAGHRGSWYDGRAPTPPRCGFVYIGAPERLPACAGTRHGSAMCGRAITECRCPG